MNLYTAPTRGHKKHPPPKLKKTTKTPLGVATARKRRKKLTGAEVAGGGSGSLTPGARRDDHRMLRCLTIVLVLGYLVPGVISQGSPGHLETSNEPYGISCGNTQCLNESRCRRRTCVCPNDEYGSGNLQCYPSNSWRAEVTGSSNILTTFLDFTAKVLWPCSYGFTDFTCTRHSNGQPCRVQIIGISTVRKRRKTIYGFRINFRCPDDPAISENGFCLMVTGVKEGDTFYYREWSLTDCEPEYFLTETNLDQYPDLTIDGSGSGDGESGNNGGGSSGGTDDEEENGDGYVWDDPVVYDLGGGYTLRITIDVDNTAVVSFADCGFEVGFRAYDETAPEHSLLYVFINDNVEFHDANLFYAGSISQSDFNNTQFYYGDDLLLYNALTFTPKQLSGPLGRICTSTAKAFQSNCNTASSQQLAVTTCSYLLTAHVVSCLDDYEGTDNPPSTNSLLAFQLCMKISCSPSQSLCRRLHSIIPESCLDLVETIFTILNCA